MSTSAPVPNPKPALRPSRKVLQNVGGVFAVALLGVVAVTTTLHTVRVNEIGLKFNKAGSVRGLSSLTVVSGYVLINPLTQEIVKFPRQQVNYTWTQTAGEGGGGDESFTFNTSDQVRLNADVNLGVQVIAEKAPQIYVRFGGNIENILHGWMHSIVRDAITRSASQFSTDQILGAGRAKFEDTVEKEVAAQLAPAGFELRNLGFVGEIRPPAQIAQAINQKFQAQQDAIRAQNKVVQSQAEAKQQVAAAQGEAESILVRARAQAAANKILAASLTPELVQAKQIEKWDGRLSTVSSAGSTSLLIDPKALSK